MTLVETDCGNGAVMLLLAEEFHLYARGVDRARRVEAARALAGRSPAARRVRFVEREAPGPVDALCALRGAVDPSLVRREGRVVLGRYLAPDGRVSEADPAHCEIVWRRTATPLEWERYLMPQERSLREYRATLRPGDEVSPVALEGERRIERFRSSRLAYELTVFVLP